MGLQNKFGVLFFGVNLLLPTFAYSLVLEPLKIDSSRGEPLYAEIPFRNAQSTTPIKVSIAQPFELGQASVLDPEKFAHLNFYVRQNAQGNGVIVITSSRAISESAIDLTLKIEDSGQVRMQSINTTLPSRIERLQNNLQEATLKPRFVANEKDIQLNLPVSSTPASQTKLKEGEQLLQLQSSTPPPLNIKSSISDANTASAVTQPKATIVAVPQRSTTEIINNHQITASSPITTTDQNKSISAQSTTSPEQKNTATINSSTTSANRAPNPNLTINITRRLSTEPAPTKVNPSPTVPEQAASIKQPATAKVESKATATKQVSPIATTDQSGAKHVVQANESLWGIAQHIASRQNISTQQVMQHIQKNNQDAFIGGNANRLKQGAILNLPSNYQPLATQQQTKTTTNPQPKQVTQALDTSKAAKQSQAHMSIVGNTHQGTAQGSQEKATGSAKAQNELTVQLKNKRGSTLDLQNNVKTLDQQLKEKERRIALLNARLAELEQQLKNKKAKSQSTSPNTTSKSQSVIPALLTGTIIAFSSLNADFAMTTLLLELV